MAKYAYDKAALKGLGVGPFLKEVKTREAEIQKADDTMPQTEYQANRLARMLHPGVQFALVSKVIPHKDARSYVLVPDPERGTQALAFFRAGQYVSAAFSINGASVCRPYTIRSGPADALGQEGTSYTLTVKETGGFVSDWILNNWKVGSKVTMSGPLGDFYYQGLRDAKHIVALAGGSGITPFCAMAAAVVSGQEDFSLTVLYGSRDHDSILLGNELLELSSRSHGRVKVVHVLSADDAEGFEHGFLSADLIRKYAPEGDYSVFVCGPQAMYAYEKEELAKLGLPARRVRFELSGAFGDPARDAAYPAEAKRKTFKLSVTVRGLQREIVCPAEETLLTAMERAGIAVPSDCRSGRCGWCRNRLISGEVFVPETADGRRAADKKFGWIHPCVTYPLSDIALEIFPLNV